MEQREKFRWRRATGRGYRWQTLKVNNRPRRVLTFPTPKGSEQADWIEPMSIHPSLIRMLAGTDPTERNILEFANAFGLLTESNFAAPGRRHFTGLELTNWKIEILAAVEATDIQEALKTNDNQRLSTMVRWEPGPRVYFKWGLGIPSDSALVASRDLDINPKLIASPDKEPESLVWFEEGDTRLPAQFFLQSLVNEKLRRHVTPRLVWTQEDDLHQRLQLSAENLIGAAWLQFAEEIDQRKRISRCPMCDAWFERTRPDKEHCSDRCRVRAHRQRKRRT